VIPKDGTTARRLDFSHEVGVRSAVRWQGSGFLFHAARPSHPVNRLRPRRHFSSFSWGDGVFSSGRMARNHRAGRHGFSHRRRRPTVAPMPTLDGKHLMTLGVPAKPPPYQGRANLHSLTHAAFSSPQGEIYVSDGLWKFRAYINNAPDGKLLLSLGRVGVRSGQFKNRAQQS